MTTGIQDDLHRIRDAVDRARDLLLHYRREGFETTRKAGGDPVTEADVAVDTLLRETLHRDGELRGCTGSLEAFRALVVDVADRAFTAGYRDPRFPPLSADEIPRVDIEISGLHLLQHLVEGLERLAAIGPLLLREREEPLSRMVSHAVAPHARVHLLVEPAAALSPDFRREPDGDGKALLDRGARLRIEDLDEADRCDNDAAPHAEPLDHDRRLRHGGGGRYAARPREHRHRPVQGLRVLCRVLPLGRPGDVVEVQRQGLPLSGGGSPREMLRM